MRLQQKVAIITGSTSGIGEAAARCFATEGAIVILTGRREEKGQAIVREIVRNGGKAHFIQADITEEKSYSKIVDETLRQYGQIDILVNNVHRWRTSLSINRG